MTFDLAEESLEVTYQNPTKSQNQMTKGPKSSRQISEIDPLID